jgi:hypothetical protein
VKSGVMTLIMCRPCLVEKNIKFRCVLSLAPIYIGRFICIVALDFNGNAKVGHNQAVPTSELLANCRRQTQTPQVNTQEKFILGVTRRPRMTAISYTKRSTHFYFNKKFGLNLGQIYFFKFETKLCYCETI